MTYSMIRQQGGESIVDDLAKLTRCNVCGSLVYLDDHDLHNMWHEALEKIAREALGKYVEPDLQTPRKYIHTPLWPMSPGMVQRIEHNLESDAPMVSAYGPDGGQLTGRAFSYLVESSNKIHLTAHEEISQIVVMG